MLLHPGRGQSGALRRGGAQTAPAQEVHHTQGAWRHLGVEEVMSSAPPLEDMGTTAHGVVTSRIVPGRLAVSAGRSHEAANSLLARPRPWALGAPSIVTGHVHRNGRVAPTMLEPTA